jgi:hypothetical protein
MNFAAYMVRKKKSKRIGDMNKELMRRIQQHKRKERLKERHKGMIHCLTRVSSVCGNQALELT